MMNNQPHSRSKLAGWHRGALSVAGICTLTLIAFWPALQGEFVWDDRLLVLKNPLVTGELTLGNVWLQTDFSLTTFALWLQWLAWGNHPLGYHVTNILLHTIACLLLWRLLRRMKIPGAWLAAAIFAVHPVAAASVAWVSEMKNTLSLVFCLTSFLLYWNFQNSAKRRHAHMFYGCSLFLFLLALLSKTSTVMLPVLLLGLSWWQNNRITRRALLQTVPFFALSLMLGCATIWFQSRVMATAAPVQSEHFFGRFAIAGQALWFYLGKIVWPINLNMIYPRWTLNEHTVISSAPALLWLIALAACWKFRNRPGARLALVGLVCFTVTLFPVLGFLSMDYFAISRVSDHLQYLPMVAVVATLSAAACKWIPAHAFSPLAIITLSLLAFATFQRSEIIAHDETLWRDTLEKNPDSFTAHNNLGCLLAAQNKLPDAMREFETTLRLRPANAPAHANLARALAMQHQFAEANAHFDAALKLKPAEADFHESYAAALAEQGRVAEAIVHLRAALQTEPKSEMRLHLAELLRATGKCSEAIVEYRVILKTHPDSVESLNNAAWLLATCPDPAARDGLEAVQLAERACALTKNEKAGMIGTLAAAYAEAGRFPDAVRAATSAAQIAEAAGDTGFASINRQLLSLYQKGQPFRDMPPR